MTYPLTQTQLGIYLACQEKHKDANYNLDMLYKLDEDIDIVRLCNALDRVIETHPYVKSRLVMGEDGDIMLEDHTADVFHTTVTETSDIENYRTHFGEDYDLLKDPLFRLEIYKTQKGNYLYFDFHHIIFDGMSMANFRKDLILSYAGETLMAEGKDGFTVALEEVQLRQTEAFAEAKAWYMQEFAAASDVDTTPLPDVFDKNDGKWTFTFHSLKNSKTEVKALCQRHNVSVSIPFTAAFGYTLAKYSAEEEALYATIFHGRSDKQTLSSYNMMVKTLPVYHDFRKTPAVQELLQQTSAQIKGTRNNTLYSFAELSQDLGLAPRVCFAFQGTIHDFSIILNGREQEMENLRVHRPGFDLGIQVMEQGEEYTCRVEYNTGMYSPEFIEQFCRTYSNILDQMLTKENLADIEIVGNSQIAQLDSFNKKDLSIELDSEATVVSEFRKQVELHPDNIAVAFREKRISYKQLDELTDKYASVIYKRVKESIEGKEGREPVVSIIIHRSEWMVLASLAALKAGCAYQPLDPSYPQDRLNFMVKDANAILLIADPDLREILNEYEGEVLLTNELEKESSKLNSTLSTLHSSLKPQTLLTLLYTSGSTGVPKGVMLEHRNLIAYSKWFRNYLSMTSESNIAAYASFGFDANMMDIYCTLMNGATLHIIDEDIRLDMEALHQYFEQEGITHCFMTTQVGVQYLENYPQSTSLQHLMMGGEKLRAVKPEELSYKIHNGYGPSETTCGCAFFQIDHWEPNIPIGKPTATCNLYIVDKYGHRLPAGAPGELWINGPQVGRGYLNRPDKTAESFTSNPFGEGRVYHSGDIVRYRQDGNIEFVGRKDGQVKIRGFRIELKEVEAVIREYPSINDVTVQAFDDPNGGKFIAAYIVSDEQVDIAALNDFIASQKPPYMVPAVTMQIDSIPLTVNQKVDKKALPEASPSAMKRKEGAMAAPMNKLEVELYNMVAGILNLPEISNDNSKDAALDITDNLKFYGLTSLTSIKLANLVFKRFAIQIDSKSLSQSGTIQSIENDILTEWMAGGAVRAVETQKVQIDEVPLTFSQQGVYSECLLNPDSTLYNIPTLIKLPSSVTVAQVESALQEFVAAHPALWSHIVTNSNGETVLRRMGKNTLVVEHASEPEVHPFNLAEGPLFRFAIIERDSSILLFADFHHLISDGASCDLFLRELCKALEGENLEHETYDYYDFAKKQALDDKDKEFFDSRIGGVEEVSMLLPDKETEEDATHEARKVSATLDLTQIAKLAEGTTGLTTSGICLAIANICVSRYLCEDEVSLCTISSGRSDARLQNTMGMFVNTLPVVSALKAEDCVVEYLQRTCQDYEETLRHENYPFVRVAQDYGYKSNIMFAYQVGVIDSYHVGHEELEIKTLTLDKAKFPLYIAVTGTTESARVVVEYDSSLYSEEMMQGLADAYSHVAEQVGCKRAESGVLLSSISLASNKTLAQLDTFNAGYLQEFADKDADIVSLFRKAATKYPNNTAVIYEAKKYTYRELDELTDRMAAIIDNKVKERIAGKEPVVSILIHRGEWMVLASLAALKAGCAYQPLDPSYPQERLNFMVKDANAALLIADPDLRSIVSEYEGEVVLTNDLKQDVSSLSLPLWEGRDGSSLFILLYTSGSTGVPKGVMLEHGNLVAFCDWYRSYYSLQPGDCVAAYASYGFDACMMDMYPALTTGASVCIVPENIRLDMVAINDYFKQNGVTHSFMTTQVGVQYLLNIKDSSLRHLSVGGEKLQSVDPAVGYDFHNGYGPTECTIFSTTHMVDKRENNIPIGRPTNHLKCYVVDKFMHRLPVGAMGELIISGRQVGRGYLNRPDKTAEAFFTLDNQRAYHSGDIVRYRKDGNIEFVGRRDGQVKIRGFRIELKEVEAVIRDYTGVKDVTVQAFDDPNGGKFIAAYVVAQNLDITALNNFIASQKPPYMVPAVTMQIDSIPLNVNQKVDKKKLPAPQLTSNDGSAEFVEPQGKLEETLARCIAETLTLEVGTISTHDTFTSLGGTSIKSIRLMALLRSNDIEIPIEQLLKHNDIRTLALIADYASRGEYVVKRTALMPAQRRLLHQHIINPDRSTNAVCVQMDIDDTITEELIRKAIDAVAKRHKAITSAVAYAGVDVPMQVFLDRPVPLTVMDAENELDAVAVMMDKRHALLQSLNHLQLLPLFQLSLCRIDGASAYLMIAYNTILAEEWRIRTWIAELFDALKEHGGESVSNWCYLLNAAIEMADDADKEDWSKEQDEASDTWGDMGLERYQAANDDAGEDNYRVLTETPGTKQLIFVHTGNTGSEAYLSLANQLEGFCSLAVLDQWNIYHQDDIKHGIPEIAKKYVEVLKKHHPHGPYYLGGWCYGGMIAYEMACQLTAQGEKVEQLFMFDAHTVKKQEFKEMFTSRTGESMREYFEHSPLFTSLIGRGLIDALVANSLQVNADMMRFRPKLYDGNVVYFKAITPAPGLKGRMAEYFNEMTSKRAGGYERYIPQDKLHIIDIKQEHDNLMNELSLSIEVPVIKQYL